MPDKQLVNSEYLLQKFAGKGGWTYARIPEILPNKKNPFGWVTVRGFVDTHELKKYKLMPMGDGSLFLPVKAEVRRKIGKQAGDYVRVVLYLDESPLEVPEELLECFANEPKKVFEAFEKLAEGAQKAYLDWIYGAKTEETKANRIASMMDRLSKGMGFYEKDIS